MTNSLPFNSLPRACSEGCAGSILADLPRSRPATPAVPPSASWTLGTTALEGPEEPGVDEGPGRAPRPLDKLALGRRQLSATGTSREGQREPLVFPKFLLPVTLLRVPQHPLRAVGLQTHL